MPVINTGIPWYPVNRQQERTGQLYLILYMTFQCSHSQGSCHIQTYFNFSHDQQPIDNFTKHNMFPIQPVTLGACDEELAAVGTRTTVCHRKQARSRVFQLEVFICKRTPIYTGYSSAIPIYEVTSLDHEILYHPVESASFITYRDTIFPVRK